MSEYHLVNIDENNRWGHAREGGGTVVYLYPSSLPEIYSIIQKIVDTVYTETCEFEGDESVDFAELDPSYMDTDLAGYLKDTVSMSQITDKVFGKETYIKKFEKFLEKDVLQKQCPLVFINPKNKTVTQILDKKMLKNIISTIVNVSGEEYEIFIRNYDHPYDY